MNHESDDVIMDRTNGDDVVEDVNDVIVMGDEDHNLNVIINKVVEDVNGMIAMDNENHELVRIKANTHKTLMKSFNTTCIHVEITKAFRGTNQELRDGDTASLSASLSSGVARMSLLE
ncbi:hypothetical protein D5086_018876 [Populus alba]|uniref:Uncharacterized protein n=1 Tax=Populus alba TaxID=43335 RepID=A0ACC4BS95_POPAL